MNYPEKLAISVMTVACLFAGNALAAEDIAAKREEIRKMCEEALTTLYKEKPETKSEIAKAPGYGCFSNIGVSFIFGGAGGGGLVYDNVNKKNTYMNMGQASAGLDIGVKDYREILVFKDHATLKKFIDSGWEFAGSASATAEAKGKGGSTEITQGDEHIKIYSMTKTGLAAGVSAAGRKYWKDKDLN